jgi:hypothetical protein
VLVQELALQQWEQWRRRNQALQLQASSLRHASIHQTRFSRLRHQHCASCGFLERQPRKQELR